MLHVRILKHIRKFTIAGGLVAGLAAPLALQAHSAEPETIRVGWCTSTINSGAVPWAVAQKLGYFEEEGLKLKLVPVKSGNECVTFVASGELPYALPALEPVASIVAKGFEGKTFYTLYHGATWRISVPADSDIQTVADLKGKKVGVASMSSVMVSVTKGLIKNAGLDPETDISFVATGATSPTVLALKRGDIDAVAKWDAAEFNMNRIGANIRSLDVPEFTSPSLGIFSSNEYFKDHKKEAAKIARAYAKGSVFTLANTEAAFRILYDVYPETRSTSVDIDDQLANDAAFLEVRKNIWVPTAAQDNKWGMSVMGAYGEYLDNLASWGIIEQKVKPEEFITNELIDEINDFDHDAVIAQAKSFKMN